MSILVSAIGSPYEEDKTLKLSIRRKAGNQKLVCAQCVQRVQEIREIYERDMRDPP